MNIISIVYKQVDKMPWEETAKDGLYQAAFSNNVVLIELSSISLYALKVTNNEGNVIFTTTEDQTVLKEIHKRAKISTQSLIDFGELIHQIEEL